MKGSPTIAGRSSLFLIPAAVILFATALAPRTAPAAGGPASQAPEPAPAAAPVQRDAQYGEFPLSFEPNQGQADSSVLFLARGSGYGLFLRANEAVLVLQQSTADQALTSPTKFQSDILHFSQASESAVLRMTFSRGHPSAAGLEQAPGRTNYLIGNNPSHWRTDISLYAKVRYKEIDPGIDLVYYGNQRQLECDFVVSPGADPRNLLFTIQGDDARWIDPNGNLVVQVHGRALRISKPVVYQETGSHRQTVSGNFVMHGAREIGFSVGRYDRTRPLIIDPVFSYSTYLGGSGTDDGNAIAVDASGNAYVTGTTASADFTSAHGLQGTLRGSANAFVTKLNSAGAVVYSTYLGGTQADGASGIAVDSSGNAYVAGFTSSPDFPTLNPFQAGNHSSLGNAFVAKLNPTGSALIYSTYLGGSNYDFANGITVNRSGNAYVTGFTQSGDFPIANALQPNLSAPYNAFVTELSTTGSALVYSTYLGGSTGDGGTAITVDSAGSAYVTGSTSSSDFPVTSNAFQGTQGGTMNAFVTKLNATGSALVYSTYLGGSQNDRGSAIAVNSSGQAYVTGSASSPNFPTANALQSTNQGGAFGNAFASKLSADGSTLLYSTYLGGNGYDYGNGIALDAAGNAWITGYTVSPNFPTMNAFQPANGSSLGNTFITEFNPAGSALLYSTYLGGNNYDYGSGIALDASGNVYLAGTASSPNFPTLNAAQASLAGGGSDAFVVKLTTGTSSGPAVTPGGIVSAASFASGKPLAPGSIATVFGSNLTSGPSCLPPCGQTLNASGNLNTPLAGAQISINGIAAPIFFATPTQLGFQVPVELPNSGAATLSINVGGQTGSPSTFTLAPAVPSLFTAGSSGSGQGAILNGLEITEGISSLSAPTGEFPNSHPAHAGDVVVIYCTGLGAVAPPVATGVLPAGQMTVLTPMVSIGGLNATVQFSGLTPGDAGLYQINAVVPAGVQSGNAIPVTVTANGQTSNSVTMAIQ